MGKSPKSAPFTAAMPASGAGMPYTSTAMPSAAKSPAIAAICARTCQNASKPSNTTTGTDATSEERISWPSGS